VRRLALALGLSLVFAAAVLGGLTLYASAGSSAPLPETPIVTTATDECGAPVLVVPPAITGTIAVGSVLHASTGTWTCDPTEFHYSWGATTYDGIFHVGGDSPDYTVFYRDDFFVTVTACNVAGCADASTCVADPENPITSNPAYDQYGFIIDRCYPPA
jgi:hypothetical protein